MKKSRPSREKRGWRNMLDRCYNPKNIGFKHYGGRGIAVCDRWRGCFEDFLADMGECPDGMTLDRFPDKNGDYEKGNCRWATVEQQNNNKRSNRNLTFNGKTQTMFQWARELNIRPDTLWRRLQKRPIEQALSLTTGFNGRNKDRCVRGHLFDEANTYRKRNGGRACRACHRMHAYAANH